MKKPTLYLDTNIVSTLHYDGTDINGLARRMATRDWWGSERQGFEIFGSVAHRMDDLLTWDYAHLANPATQERGEIVVSKLGYRMPWLVSPDSIPRATLGQTIRRPKS